MTDWSDEVRARLEYESGADLPDPTSLDRGPYSTPNRVQMRADIRAALAEIERLKGYMRPDQIEEAETIKGLVTRGRLLQEAVELALDLFENGMVDFKKYGLKKDADIAERYRAALRGKP